MNKKASMELGINAIVILIIALALLGLAMAFITNLFKGGQSKLGSLIDRTDLPVHADATNSLVFDNSDVTVKAGKNTKVVISVYNSDFGANDVLVELMGCVDSTNTEVEAGFITLAAPVQQIPLGTDGGYKAIITVSGDANPDNYICTVRASGGDGIVSNQLFVNVVR